MQHEFGFFAKNEEEFKQLKSDTEIKLTQLKES